MQPGSLGDTHMFSLSTQIHTHTHSLSLSLSLSHTHTHTHLQPQWNTKHDFAKILAELKKS